MNQENTRARFESIANADDEDIRIDEAALVIAAETDANVDVSAGMAFLDQMAERFEASQGQNTMFGVSIARLIDFIHLEEKFNGNIRDYYDPSNSYLNRVLEQRAGIPITLALVHISLGERLDIPVYGVKFPGHFLVKYGKENRLIVDPFAGRILSEPDCGTLLKQIAGTKAVLQPHYFDTASRKDIMIRILDNLKQIFWRKKQWDESKRCIERQQLLRPEEAEYAVQLGAVYEMQGNIALAHQTYTHIVQQSSNEQIRILASKRLLAMRSGNPTIH
ncbi:MAG: regulator of sirC expression with transglutaminase-like and TPR domain [Candidatus Azotimanducaceae bacterium]|jgi:regulator of sirC expression with transglutaminase-like and TPR domain